jgi:hypothetical protein
VPEILANCQAKPDAQARVDGAQPVARGEETPLVKEAVSGQEELAVDEPDFPVLHEGGADEESVVVRFLHKRNHGRHSGRLGGKAQQPRVVGAHRHLGRQILQLVAGQAQLREDDKVRSA